ncbi:MAG: hypothetical protein HOH20_14185 [Rhodospirillaceae bacterium]|jgi:hypothetical protein|nr:hypothetical protein [Rhodospirillaceae bacterium]MBT5566630.1 hypothetical protein [Rhodospirillaceae bacterium]MBT6090720.1 hypothetical protein [Rhodospirillaceae bacterium]MBT6962261.1 hypothetical protein [Rhodospirillaceae bacterium]
MTGLIPVCKRGRPRRAEVAIAPTPETVAKLQRDQVSDLLKQGELNPDQERVARKILSFSLALTRGMFPQSRIQAAAPLPARSLPQAPLERLSDSESELWSKVYRPWAGEMSRQLVGRRPKLTALSVVERIVNENNSPYALSSAFDLPRKQVLDGLRQALMDILLIKEKKTSCNMQ